MVRITQLLSLCLLAALGSMPTTAHATSETVDIGVPGLFIPGEEAEPAAEKGSTDSVIEPNPPAEALPAAEIETAPPVDPVADQAASSLAILDYLGDTSGLAGPVLTLEEAIELALANNPELVTLALEVDARLAQVLQARIKPSPELDISLSEFLGMNDRRHFRNSVSEVTYSKTVEKLEKRLARMRVARLGGDVARWDYEAAVRDIQQAVARAYVDVLVAQETLRVQELLLNLAEGLRGAVALRFEAGTVSELELSRLEIEVDKARISRDQTGDEFDAARRRLSALWGDLSPDFAAVAGRIDNMLLPPEAEQLIAHLPDNPFLARFAAEALERQARLQLALVESRPDYTVRGGVQGFGDSGEMALTVGITIPTQRGRLNPGEIREAEVRLEQLESQRAATQTQLQMQLVDAVERLRVAYRTAEALKGEVIPAAIDNVDRTTVGYRYGKFSYLDVLESERTLIDAVAEYVEALADYQLARVDLERLIGKPLAAVSPAGTLEISLEAEAEQEPAESAEEFRTEVETETHILEDGNG
jgi:outer membrane protein, heavy metal efflux system